MCSRFYNLSIKTIMFLDFKNLSILTENEHVHGESNFDLNHSLGIVIMTLQHTYFTAQYQHYYFTVRPFFAASWCGMNMFEPTRNQKRIIINRTLSLIFINVTINSFNLGILRIILLLPWQTAWLVSIYHPYYVITHCINRYKKESDGQQT